MTKSNSYTSITTVRPSDDYILEALSSIELQSIPPERILVIVNGGSLDDGNVAIDVRRHFPRAEIHQLDEPGTVPAMRMALKICSTEFITFLDADDIWMPEKSKMQLRILQENKLLDAVYGGVQNFTSQKNIENPIGDNVAARLFPATTFHRRAFEKNGYPDSVASHFNWLYRWWMKAANTGVVTEGHPEIVLKRRISKVNLWKTEHDTGIKTLFAELRESFRDGLDDQ
jgi:glycosyltransferase involved in cell wall biosynthesis